MKVELLGRIGNFDAARINGRECFWRSSVGLLSVRWADNGEKLGNAEYDALGVETLRAADERDAKDALAAYALAKSAVSR